MASAAASAALGSRAEAALLADQLALAGGKKLGREGDRLLEQAARVRERLYRRERRQVDALEAVETLRELARRPGHECAAVLRRVVLEAELTRDPATAHRALQSLTVDGSDCRLAKARALTLLAAYRSADDAPKARTPAEVATSAAAIDGVVLPPDLGDRKSTRLNSSHL